MKYLFLILAFVSINVQATESLVHSDTNRVRLGAELTFCKHHKEQKLCKEVVEGSHFSITTEQFELLPDSLQYEIGRADYILGFDINFLTEDFYLEGDVRDLRTASLALEQYIVEFSDLSSRDTSGLANRLIEIAQTRNNMLKERIVAIKNSKK